MSASASLPPIDKQLLADLARTIRGLAIDGVEKANSGHPGMPMGCADFAALLFHEHLRYDPKAPSWPDRDRFVLSAGHGSMLMYSMLHLCGYEAATMEELQRFRQLGSKTPGHPENFLMPGVETTTGPLGQGFGNAVGMALAAEMMSARFPGLIDHKVYAIVSDGDLMEGVAAEAASFAGHHKLGRCVFFYDDNGITIEGHTTLTFSGENVGKRFEAYGWHVVHADGHDFDSMHKALCEAKAVTDRPSLIVGRTVIGFGSPNKADTHDVHGSPLGAAEMKLTKEKLGLPTDKTFWVPENDRTVWAKRAEAGQKAHRTWKEHLDAQPKETREAFLTYLEKPLPELSQYRPTAAAGKSVATRKSAGDAENAYAAHVPWLVGGSADLAPSTNTLIKGSDSVGAGAYAGRNLHYGIREHGMGSIMNGMALSGFFHPFGATFMVFSDYMRPSVRLAALMGLRVTYVFTHDSIFLGEDGPTHQPVEHLAALRAIPDLTVMRPADSDEAAVAWEFALGHDGPTALVLSRQNLPNLDRGEGKLGVADGLKRGGYVLKRESGAAPAVILIATGSEVSLALEAAKKLEADGVATRVVSMPSIETFRRQSPEYHESVLPAKVRARVVIEAGIRMGWEGFATEAGGYVVMSSFGASAPAGDLAKHFGFTVENLVAVARRVMGSK